MNLIAPFYQLRNKFVLFGLLACIATMVPVIAVASRQFGAPTL
jgi:hypothetical protein